MQAAVASEVEPLLPKGTSVNAWAAGLADKEPSRKTKPARSKMYRQEVSSSIYLV